MAASRIWAGNIKNKPEASCGARKWEGAKGKKKKKIHNDKDMSNAHRNQLRKFPAAKS